MDEVSRFLVRMLGDDSALRGAEDSVRGRGAGDRGAMLHAAVAAVRQGAEPASEPVPTAPAATDPAAPDRPTDPERLKDAVAGELAAATAGLSLAEREVLALRELLRLSHAEIAGATDVAREDVAPLLARARVHLRARLRGSEMAQLECDERERALRVMVLRQDGEDVPAAEENWLIDHLGHCRGCRQLHAAMLEASACYRAWADPEVPSDPVAASAGAP